MEFLPNDTENKLPTSALSGLSFQLFMNLFQHQPIDEVFKGFI